jgi:hypothetical protein
VLRKLAEPSVHPLPARTQRMLWALTTTDIMAVAWMLAAGDWLDHASRLSSVITLGGHHRVVLALALVGFALLAALAPVTRGFSTANRMQLAGIVVAGTISLVALAGVLSVALLVAGSMLLVGFVGRLLLR